MRIRAALLNLAMPSMVLAPLSARADAATIWNDPLTTWSQPSANASLEENRDRLEDRVAITRGLQNGLITPLIEPEYVRFIGPAEIACAHRFNNLGLDPAEITATNCERLAFSGGVSRC